MKKFFALVMMALTVFVGATFGFSTVETNAAPSPVNPGKAGVVTATVNGEDVMTKVTTYASGDTAMPAETKTALDEATTELTNPNWTELGVKDALATVAGKMYESYTNKAEYEKFDESVFAVAEIFDVTYEEASTLTATNTLNITFEMENSANTVLIHRVGENSWKVAETKSNDATSITVAFDSLCPVAVLKVSDSLLTKATPVTPDTKDNSGMYLAIILTLCVIVLALIVLLIILVALLNKKNNAPDNTPTEAPKAEETKEEPVQEEVKEEPVEEPVEEPAQEEVTEEPVEETPVEEETAVAEDEGLTLKESLAIEGAVGTINKNCIGEYLTETYGENVTVNLRANYISNGILPLADTHYTNTYVAEDGTTQQREKPLCFMYVYERNDGSVLMLVKTNDKHYKKLKAEHKNVSKSKFPKSSANNWYAVPVDDTFTKDQILEVISEAKNVCDTEIK